MRKKVNPLLSKNSYLKSHETKISFISILKLPIAQNSFITFFFHIVYFIIVQKSHLHVSDKHDTDFLSTYSLKYVLAFILQIKQ